MDISEEATHRVNFYGSTIAEESGELEVADEVRTSRILQDGEEELVVDIFNEREVRTCRIRWNKALLYYRVLIL